MQLPPVLAPSLPAPGAILSAPLTGQGPHRVEQEVARTQASQAASAASAQATAPTTPPILPPKRPPVAPPASPPRRPPLRQSQPVVPTPPVSQQPQQIPQMAGMANWLQGPAFTTMVTQAMNSQRPAAQKFYLWLLEEGGWPTLETYDDMAVFVARIKSLIGQPFCLCPFMGFHLTITNGPLRYLQTPMGPIALFDTPDGAAAPGATYGWVGPDMDVPQPPDSDTEDTLIADDPLLQQDDAPADDNQTETVAGQADDTPMF